MNMRNGPARCFEARGFSLVELMVVICVVAVLTALLMPSLSRAREQARRVVCGSQMRQFALALVNYDYAHKQLPPGNDGTRGGPIGGGVHIILRNEYNIPKKLTICPSGYPPRDVNRQWDDNNTPAGLGYYYLAGHGNRSTFPASFGWDPSGFPLRSLGYFPLLSLVKDSPHAFVKLPVSRLPLMKDNSYWVNTSLYASGYNPPSGQPHQFLSPLPSHEGARPYSAEGGNVLFGDARVEWHNQQPGVSWAYCHAAGNAGYWLPSDPAPSGASLLN